MTRTEQVDAVASECANADCAPAPDWSGASVDAIWRAITRDAGCAVVVVNDQGLIDFANQTAAAMLSPDKREVVGRRVSEFASRPFVEERMAHCRRVMETGVPLVIVGMSHGAWGRTTIRPMAPDHAGRRRVLVTRPVPGPEIAAGHDPAVVQAKTSDMGRLGPCTPRELEVLRLIGFGLSTPDIAARLFRSVKTIETHRVSLGHKLGLHNRVELARLAIDAGLTHMTDREMADLISQDDPGARQRKAG